jgi:hypothetical protein
MESPGIPFLRVLTDAAGVPGGPLYIIVSRKYVYLADVMAQGFKDRTDVHIIVDRRQGERRRRQQPVTLEWRRQDRRRPTEEVLAVVMGQAREPHRTQP